ncbi:MAG: hypothetical protein COY02_00430, partial [Parcubacteria group bacterium CG_4_10_14_0_2_um_filter_41_6]
AELNSVGAFKDGLLVEKKINLVLRKNTHILIAGPNGIGKSTLLEKLSQRSGPSNRWVDNVVSGYYKQDFGNLDFDKTAYNTLLEVMEGPEDEHKIRASAASFLLDGKILASPVGALSEGQKGLLSFCRLMLMKPGLLILDEPTNHINFRHLPVIAKALDQYKGALIMVSHIPDFVAQIRIDEVIDLGDI